MDPLSATASILTVIGAAGALVKGFKKVVDLGHAKAELSSLLKELAGLEIVIRLVENAKLTLQERENPGWQTRQTVPGLDELLSMAKASVLKLKELVYNDLTRLSSSGNVKIDKFRWIKDKSLLSPIQQDIQSVRGNLVACLSASGL